MDKLKERMVRLKKEQSSKKGTKLFEVRTANEAIENAKTSPKPKRLFGNFWIQGEVCFLFSSSGVGKTILAVQIAESLATGTPVTEEFELDLTEGRPVIYCDFELTDKQFEGRYADSETVKVQGKDGKTEEYYKNHHVFSPNFIRITPKKEKISPDEIEARGGYAKIVMEEISDLVAEKKPIAVILDNITYLNSEMEKAKEALKVVFELKTLAEKNAGLSVLILGHTPKRDKSKPLTQDDLAGSKMITNFIDASFAIGESAREARIRYLKQTKVRSAQMEFHAENSPTFIVEKPYNFLRYAFQGYSSEREHLSTKEDGKKDIDGEIETLLMEGKGVNEVARALGLNKSRVSRFKKAMEERTLTEMGKRLEKKANELPEVLDDAPFNV